MTAEGYIWDRARLERLMERVTLRKDAPFSTAGLLSCLEELAEGRPRDTQILYECMAPDADKKEIAAAHGVGTERIRQVEAKLLRLLRHPLRQRIFDPSWDKATTPPAQVLTRQVKLKRKRFQWKLKGAIGTDSGAVIQFSRGPRIDYYGGGVRYNDSRSINRWGRRAYFLVLHWLDPKTRHVTHEEHFLEIHKCLDVSPASFEVYRAPTPDLEWHHWDKGAFLVEARLCTVNLGVEDGNLSPALEWDRGEDLALEAVYPRLLREAGIPSFKEGEHCPSCKTWGPTEGTPGGLGTTTFSCPACGLRWWWGDPEPQEQAAG